MITKTKTTVAVLATAAIAAPSAAARPADSAKPAAPVATPRLRDDTSALQAEVDAMAAAAVADDVHATVEHSERFHRLIIEASGNQLLETIWSSLSITDHTALTMVTLSLDLGTLARSHQPIVDAIAAGDIELACRVSREHQAWFEELLTATAKKGSRHEADEAVTGSDAPEPDATAAISA